MGVQFRNHHYPESAQQASNPLWCRRNSPVLAVLLCFFVGCEFSGCRNRTDQVYGLRTRAVEQLESFAHYYGSAGQKRTSDG